MADPVTLFHVSDVHFGAEDPEALDWFRERVAEEKPDAVVMTGDLTMRARSREFEAGAAWLQSLGVPLTVEVGNHDLPYYSDPIRRFFRPYRRYGATEALLEQPLELPGVAIVPLKTTARAQWRWDWSKGYVNSRRLKRTLGLIREVPKGKLIFVAAHHPLVDAGTHATARTRNGRAALAALADAVNGWLLAGSLDAGPRGSDAAALAQRLAGTAAAAGSCHADVASALAAALALAGPDGRVLAFGSFHAASEALRCLNAVD